MTRRRFLRVNKTSVSSVSGPDVVCWGDSMTAQGYPQLLATVVPNTTRNAGVGGESSTTIAARQGATPFYLQPVSGSIPASGGAAVTITQPAGQWPLLQGGGVPGETGLAGPLAGVQGVLTLAKAGAQYAHDPADVYTFTRTTAGVAVPVESGQPFVTNFSEARRGDIAVIWSGQNNFGEPDQIISDIENMIEHMSRTNKRYLVLGIVPSSDRTVSQLATIASLNQRLADIYGDRFVDTLGFLQHDALAEASIIATAQDTQDIASGYTPSSLRQDVIHLNLTGRQLIANLVGRTLYAHGWVASCQPITFTSPSATLWVSGTGNDGNAGTQSAPLKTLAAARTKVRTLTTNGTAVPSGGVQVNVMAGTYPQSSTFVLSAADTGTANAPIVWKAYGGEVNITGSVTISSSAYQTPSTTMQALFPSAIRSQIKMVDLAALGIGYSAEIASRGDGEVMPTAVTVDGQLLSCARYPNTGWLSMEPGSTGGTTSGSGDDGTITTLTPAVFKETDATVLSWAGATGKAMVVAQPVFQWSTQYANITAIDKTNQTVTIDQASTWGTPDTTLGRYYIYNLPQALDTPQEYYLDSTSGKLYFVPGTTVTVATVSGPIVQLTNLSHVRFDGINVCEGRQYGIYAMNCSNISIAHGEVKNVNTGITYETTTNSLIDSMHVHHIGCTGIGVSGGDKPSLTRGNSTIVNCEVDHFALRQLSYAPGVSLYGVGHTLLHSNIHDTPHEAVITWGCDHLIQDNWIHHVVNDNADAGAFYTGRDWTDRGNILNRNLFSDIGTSDFRANSQIAIYFDDCSSGYTATNNIIVRGSRPFHHCGRDNFIANNVIVDAQDMAYYVGNWGANHQANQNTLTNRYNTVVNAANFNASAWAKYPHFLDILSDEPAVPKYNTIKNNLIAGTTPGSIETSAIVPQVAVSGNQMLDTEMLGFDVATMTAARNSPIVAGKGSFQGIDITKIYGCSVNGTESTAPSMITNLAVAPEPGLFPLGWTGYGGAGIPFSNSEFAYTIETVTGMRTAQVARATTQSTCTNPFEIAFGQYYAMGTVTAGKMYTASMQVRPSSAHTMRLRFRFYNADRTIAQDVYGAWAGVAANTPTTISGTVTAPSDSVYVSIAAFSQAVPVAGSYVDATAGMLTLGTVPYTFADGNSAGWVWSGTTGKSTSTGPVVTAALITNLSRAPEPGLFPLGWTGYGGAGIPFSNDQFAYTIETVSGMATAQVARATIQPTCANPLEIACGQNATSMTQVSAGSTYTASMQVRPSVTALMRLRFRFYDASNNTVADVYSAYQTVTAGVATTLSGTAQVPTGASLFALSAFTQSTLASGQYVDVTTCMVTEGSTAYKFADGNTSGWVWNGAAGKSTSTGLPV